MNAATRRDRERLPQSVDVAQRARAGNPPRRARTARASRAARWRTAWPWCGRGTSRSRVTMAPAPRVPGPLAGDLDGRLVRLGAAVAEEDLAAVGQPRESLGQPGLRLGVEQVRAVDQPAHLLAHRLDHPRMAVAEVVDRQPGDEVQVAAAVAPDQLGALARHDLQGLAGVGGAARSARVQRRHLGETRAARALAAVAATAVRRLRARHHASPPRSAAGRTFVPTPESSVRISSRTECGTRPSMMWAAATPASRAASTASSLGIMPVDDPARVDQLPDFGPASHSERRLDSSAKSRVETGDIGEEDELLGLQGRRQRGGHRVGVDVVALAVRTHAHRGHHRHVVGLEQVEQVGVDRRRPRPTRPRSSSVAVGSRGGPAGGPSSAGRRRRRVPPPGRPCG